MNSTERIALSLRSFSAIYVPELGGVGAASLATAFAALSRNMGTTVRVGLTSNKLGRSEEAKNTLIAKVLTHLDKIDFELEKADSDVLGEAYEYLIGQFASGAGKKAGEFYMPQRGQHDPCQVRHHRENAA